MSPSNGDENIIPVNGDTNDPDPLTTTPSEQIGKERLDHWAAATAGCGAKVMMGGDSDYGFKLGFGRRNGFIEEYLYEIPCKSIGQIIDSKHYLIVDETSPVIKNNLVNGDENEEYAASYVSQYGYLASFPYRYFSSSLRTIQMRMNNVQTPLPLLPDLFAYMGNAIGRTVKDSPDAWCWLRQDSIFKYGQVKNFENWLYQRDSVGYITAPAMRIEHSFDQWMCPRNAEFDYIARTGSKIGFQLDTAFFLQGVHKVAIKISYQDIPNGNLVLVYNDVNQNQQTRTILTNGSNEIKTTTFFVNPYFYSISGKYDFELHSDSQVPVVLVRVVKDAPNYVVLTELNSTDLTKTIIYPNPVINKMHITTTVDGELKIVNLFGQIIYTANIHGDLEIDSSSFNPGVYTVIIKNKNGFETTKFIK